ncbi:NUDIX hydrolase [Dactylosporangium sp. McL0621]|uniref:NUDIX hydrolase n=1 Tax=Dactylosporangium sp. McL0621 TaxID=3415678 RepID=UPI003CF49140
MTTPDPAGRAPAPAATEVTTPDPAGRAPAPAATEVTTPDPAGRAPAPAATEVTTPDPAGRAPAPAATEVTTPEPAADDEPMPTVSGGQHWLVSWHPPAAEPVGRDHGAAGICVAGDGRDLVLISPDGVFWGFPAGRPEGAETPRETLARELREEACVEVREARRLGWSRSACVRGRELGLVLVRSYWLARVAVGAWEPRFEIAHRRIVPASEAADRVRDPDAAATRISMRALREAGLL